MYSDKPRRELLLLEERVEVRHYKVELNLIMKPIQGFGASSINNLFLQ
jgi:hypothetical protein